LAGGLGTRLRPLTNITNKHLLPVYDRPMIYYPIQALVTAGVTEIMVVVGGNHAGEFIRLLGNGEDFGLRGISYAYQKDEGGIAQALGLAEHFAGGNKICVHLGDNIYEYALTPYVTAFNRQERGARVLLKEVDNPQEYGVATMRGNKVVDIVEKPEKPASNLAVTGVYFYDGNVFNVIKTLKPSGRGELEITDVNNHYARAGTLSSDIVPGGWWDAGVDVESLYVVSTFVRENGANKDHSGALSTQR
jgi:glucose-1-phosphate thymidylyltransferase